MSTHQPSLFRLMTADIYRKEEMSYSSFNGQCLPAPVDLKRCQSFAGIMFTHFHEQEPGFGNQRLSMTECDAPPLILTRRSSHRKHLANRKRLSSKRFISLDKIDISQLPANTLQATTGRIYRRNSINAGSTHTGNARCGPALQIQRSCFGSAPITILLPHRLWILPAVTRTETIK